MGNSTSTNIPGLRANCGLSTSRRTLMVRVAGSNWGRISLTVAIYVSSWPASVTFTFSPGLTYLASFLNKSARIQTRLKSASRYNSSPLTNFWPAVRFRVRTKLVAGALMIISWVISRLRIRSLICRLLIPRFIRLYSADRF